MVRIGIHKDFIAMLASFQVKSYSTDRTIATVIVLEFNLANQPRKKVHYMPMRHYDMSHVSFLFLQLFLLPLNAQ